MNAPLDVLAVMVRDSTDAEKFRIANQHAFQNVTRIDYRHQSDAARAAMAELIDAVSAYKRSVTLAQERECRQAMFAALARVQGGES